MWPCLERLAARLTHRQLFLSHVACILAIFNSGVACLYPVISDFVFTHFNLTQPQVGSIAIASQIGVSFYMPAALLMDSMGPRWALAVGLLVSSVGWFFTWWSFRLPTSGQPNFMLLSVIFFFTGCSRTFCYSAGFVTMVTNCPDNHPAKATAFLDAVFDIAVVFNLLVYRTGFLHGQIEGSSQQNSDFLFFILILSSSLYLIGIPFTRVIKQEEYTLLLSNEESQSNTSLEKGRDKSDTASGKGRDRSDTASGKGRDKSDTASGKGRDKSDTAPEKGRDKSDTASGKGRDNYDNSSEKGQDKTSDQEQTVFIERLRVKNEGPTLPFVFSFEYQLLLWGTAFLTAVCHFALFNIAALTRTLERVHLQRYLLALSEAGVIACRILFGVIFDRVRRSKLTYYILVAFAVICVVSQCLFLVPLDSDYPLLAAYLLSGAVEGTVYLAVPVIVLELFGIRHLGRNVAIAYTTKMATNVALQVLHDLTRSPGALTCFGIKCILPGFLVNISLALFSTFCCLVLSRRISKAVSA